MRATFLIVFAFISIRASSQIDSCSEIKKYLNIIKRFVTKKDEDSSLRRAYAVYFLEKASKIYSDSPIIAEAQLDPTIEDYNKWRKWFLKNRNRICLK